MEAAAIAKLSRRPFEEQARRTYPDAFPALPGLPAARYADPAFFELEREAVFAKSWLFAAHADQLPNPGDYLRLDHLREPLMLVRDRAGAVGAFFNTCQHRGAPLVHDKSGNAGSRLVCKYHSWSYTLSGDLVGYPEAHNFPPSLDRACLGLKRVRCETWGKFIFVNLANDTPPLREALAPVAAELDGIIGDAAQDTTHLVTHDSMELSCNWKLPVDANIETYHVHLVHRTTAAPVLDDTAMAQWLLPHGHSRMLINFRNAFPTGLPLPPFTGGNELCTQGIYSFHLFPNLSVVFGGPNLCFFIAVWPLAADRCLYNVHYLTAAKRSDANTAFLDQLIGVNRTVLNEDLDNLPFIQRSIATGGIRELCLQYMERRIYYLHEEIDRRIGPNVPPALKVTPLLAAHVEG